MKRLIGVVLAVGVAACAGPPPQRHSMASLVGNPTSTPLADCALWLDSVVDRQGDETRGGWHGLQRVDVDEVADAVASMVRGLGVAESGAPELGFHIEVLNAYMSTVAGMRAFNLVMRVHHHDGEAWVARGRSVNVPWTLSEASVRHTLEQALTDARGVLVSGLVSRCAAAAQGDVTARAESSLGGTRLVQQVGDIVLVPGVGQA